MNVVVESASQRIVPALDSKIAGSAMAGVVIALLALTFVMYWDSAQALMKLWSDTQNKTYTHGFLIAALSLWLVARRHQVLRSITASPSLAAGCAVIAVGALWLIAVRAGIQIGYVLLLPVLMWLVIYAACGRRIAYQIAFPVAYLIFAIPVWGELNPLLQRATVLVTGSLLELTAIPAYIEGNFVHLGAGVFEVADGCSGLHFFTVALALAALYGEIGRDSLKVRAQLIAIAALLALATNWIRVYAIVVAGYLTDMQHYLVRVDHYNFGWAVFAVMMTVFFLIARHFPQSPPDTATVEAVVANHVSFSRIVACLLCALAVPLFAWLRPLQAAPLSSQVEMMPVAREGWGKAVNAQAGRWMPTFAGADQQALGTYVDRTGHSVQLYIAAYEKQAQGKELVGYDDSLLDEKAEQVVSQSRLDRGDPVTELMIESAQGQSLLWYSYKVGGLQTDRGIVAQLWYGVASLAGAPLSEVIAIRSDCVPDCGSARSRIASFVDAGLSGSLR